MGLSVLDEDQLETRIKLLEDGLISTFPKRRRHHSGIKRIRVTEEVQKESVVMDMDFLTSDDTLCNLYPKLILNLYTMMAENESSSTSHRFKIVPGSLNSLYLPQPTKQGWLRRPKLRTIFSWTTRAWQNQQISSSCLHHLQI